MIIEVNNCYDKNTTYLSKNKILNISRRASFKVNCLLIRFNQKYT